MNRTAVCLADPAVEPSDQALDEVAGRAMIQVIRRHDSAEAAFLRAVVERAHATLGRRAAHSGPSAHTAGPLPRQRTAG